MQARTPLSGFPTHPTPNHPFPLCSSFHAFVSRDTLRRMTLTRLCGAQYLRDPLIAQLLGEWLASSPLAKARW